MKLREASYGVLTVVIALVIFLALIEVALRVYTARAIIYDVEMTRYANEIKRESANPLIGHVHAPNREATLMGVDVKINSDGFRDRDYPVKPDGSYRIIFLGDSLTFGWGVEKSKTFEELLETELNKRKPTEIINFGTGNYNTEQEVNLFLEKGLKYKPDEVVVFYFINDAEPTPHMSKWEILGHSRAITFFWSRLNTVLTMFGEHPSFHDYYAGLYADDRPGWNAAKKAFIQLRDVCRQNKIAVRVVLLPEMHNLHNYPFTDEHRKVVSFLSENGMQALDLAPFFAQEMNPRQLWVAPDDAHPNAIAHAMIARYSLDFIAEPINARKTVDGD